MKKLLLTLTFVFMFFLYNYSYAQTLLKQSTAATIVMGAFIDSTDGDTQETVLTISQTDIRISKNGGAFAQTNNTVGATHMEKGNYSVPLDATDTNTLGRLRVHIHEAGALYKTRSFMVVSADAYNISTGAALDGNKTHGDYIKKLKKMPLLIINFVLGRF